MTQPDFSELAIPPVCKDCGAIQRPDVVLFGEYLPAAALDRYGEEFDKGFDLIFVIGTNAVFPYIQQPVLDAPRLGCATVEINPDETLLSAAKTSVPTLAGEQGTSGRSAGYPSSPT